MSYTNGLDKPSDYFNTVLYTGNNGSQTVTGLDFQPDWVWIKDRDGTERHCLTDSVRGVLQELRSNETAAESDRSGGTPGIGGVSAFNSNGFSLVHDDGYNDNNSLQVSWNWLASNTTASNTDGTITSTVSANQTAGFSIGTYNGTSADNTVGHGLGVAPDMIFVKCKSTVHDWVVYHSALGNAKILTLNATTAAQSATGWQSTSPTSTVFSIDNAANSLNQSGQSFVFYAFASKKGYSKFGSYTGNGNADGTFVYTGFKPAWVMIKESSASADWFIFDTKRIGFNGGVYRLKANTSESENTSNVMDILSNGFKLRVSDGDKNGSGDTYIYMAFAENPFVTSTGIPCTAR